MLDGSDDLPPTEPSQDLHYKMSDSIAGQPAKVVILEDKRILVETNQDGHRAMDVLVEYKLSGLGRSTLKWSFRDAAQVKRVFGDLDRPADYNTNMDVPMKVACHGLVPPGMKARCNWDAGMSLFRGTTGEGSRGRERKAADLRNPVNKVAKNMSTRKEKRLRSRTELFTGIAFNAIVDLDPAFKVYHEDMRGVQRELTDPNDEFLLQMMDASKMTWKECIIAEDRRRAKAESEEQLQDASTQADKTLPQETPGKPDVAL